MLFAPENLASRVTTKVSRLVGRGDLCFQQVTAKIMRPGVPPNFVRDGSRCGNSLVLPDGRETPPNNRQEAREPAICIVRVMAISINSGPTVEDCLVGCHGGRFLGARKCEGVLQYLRAR
jgi:hypothetical protein